MKDYNHDGKNILEATGVDALDISLKATDLLSENGDVDSQFIEKLENTFNKRQLAVMSAMFIKEISNKKDTPEKEDDVQVLEINKEDMPAEFLKFIQEKIAQIKAQGFDPDCNCKSCTEARLNSAKSGGTFEVNIGGEGGQC